MTEHIIQKTEQQSVTDQEITNQNPSSATSSGPLPAITPLLPASLPPRDPSNPLPHVQTVDVALVSSSNIASSIPGPTTSTSNEDSDLVIQEHLYEHGNKSAIKSLRKGVLVAMCVNRFKGKESEYKRWSKPELVEQVLTEVSHELPCVCFLVLIIYV